MEDAAAPLDDPRALADLARGATGLLLLLLVGSRARGDAHAGSDWDLAYLADPAFDPAGFTVEATVRLGTEAVDVVDLATATALFRYRAARDGALLFEALPGVHRAFVLAATLYWCDVEPVLRDAYASVLRSLG